tara:strand:+ start:22 stop:387 length:366 start_codon:yes stop_codon:yes gene_type:complete
MTNYEHTIIARQDFTKSQIDALITKYSNIINKNDGEILKIEEWGILSMSHKISKNTKGNYLHFKITGTGSTIHELEKNERIDKNLLRFLTVRVKKHNLEKNYFTQEENLEKNNEKKTKKQN